MVGTAGLGAGRGPEMVEEDAAVRTAKMLAKARAGTINFFMLTPHLPEIPDQPQPL
jgi:hypothetical protein